MSEIPDNLKYTEEHEWIKVSDGEARYGITDHAQDELGDIVYVELPEVGEEISKGDMLGVIESVKTVSDLYAPLSGTVKDVNVELEVGPEMMNEDPYGDGWIVVIEIADEDELDELLDPEEYEETFE
ncbi:MAG: glycine cleavage system protein GcvH [Candidatus Thermoplasmatota archaeon]|nr:glycine cleavage system protein GcvH [Candidatus Thermoplasmatota archaeon]MBS3790079.1 glycine cleavage system protein GcvH [Candidatus Thermoplasmatota archaeon]